MERPRFEVPLRSPSLDVQRGAQALLLRVLALYCEAILKLQ